MSDFLEVVLDWLVPAAVVFGIAALVVAIIALSVRAARRGPRARAAADAAKSAAGTSLVALDDAVAELDLEVGLSGALYGGDASAALRRARMSAQHSRDGAFADFRHVLDDAATPAQRRAVATRVRDRADRALADVQKARAAHAAWVARNVDARDQLVSARRRLAESEATRRGADVFLSEMADRFDPAEWSDAAREARASADGIAAARDALDRAEEQASDPSRSILPLLAAAERGLRAAEEGDRRVELDHRRVTQAATAVAGEIAAARAALRAALSVRSELTPAAADRLGAAISAADAEIDAAARSAERRPTAAIDAIARTRDRLDLALGDARSAQQRLRGARSALPGTLAAARNAIAHAAVAVQTGNAGAESRVRLAAAEDALADARRAEDPVAALDAARRALRHADDAKALVDYARMTHG